MELSTLGRFKRYDFMEEYGGATLRYINRNWKQKHWTIYLEQDRNVKYFKMTKSAFSRTGIKPNIMICVINMLLTSTQGVGKSFNR